MALVELMDRPEEGAEGAADKPAAAEESTEGKKRGRRAAKAAAG
jgi:hypothetical protein